MCKLTSYVHTLVYFRCQSSLLEDSKCFPTAYGTLLEVKPSQNFLFPKETGVATLFDPAENMAAQQFQYVSHYESGLYFSYKLDAMWQEGGVMGITPPWVGWVRTPLATPVQISW